VEGQNLTFDAHRSAGRLKRWPDLAVELARLKVQ
jgi:hypothetical protein